MKKLGNFSDVWKIQNIVLVLGMLQLLLIQKIILDSKRVLVLMEFLFGRLLIL